MSYRYRKSHCGDKTAITYCFLHGGISYTLVRQYVYHFKTETARELEPRTNIPKRSVSLTSYMCLLHGGETWPEPCLYWKEDISILRRPFVPYTRTCIEIIYVKLKSLGVNTSLTWSTFTTWGLFHHQILSKTRIEWRKLLHPRQRVSFSGISAWVSNYIAHKTRGVITFPWPGRAVGQGQ